MKRSGGRNKSQSAKRRLEVLVEEESADEALTCLLRTVLRDEPVTFKVRRFQGKPDLLKKLPDRLRGYANARARGEDVRIVVLVDRDDDDCVRLKKELDQIVAKAGLVSRARQSAEGFFCVLNRIAVRELETWYFGDWQAVRTAFPKAPAQPGRAFRRNPDSVGGKHSDAFQKELRKGGVSIAAKPEWGRRIGPHLDPRRNSSASFRAFVEGVLALVRSEPR